MAESAASVDDGGGPEGEHQREVAERTSHDPSAEVKGEREKQQTSKQEASRPCQDPALAAGIAV